MSFSSLSFCGFRTTSTTSRSRKPTAQTRPPRRKTAPTSSGQSSLPGIWSLAGAIRLTPPHACECRSPSCTATPCKPTNKARSFGDASDDRSARQTRSTGVNACGNVTKIEDEYDGYFQLSFAAFHCHVSAPGCVCAACIACLPRSTCQKSPPRLDLLCWPTARACRPQLVFPVSFGTPTPASCAPGPANEKAYVVGIPPVKDAWSTLTCFSGSALPFTH